MSCGRHWKAYLRSDTRQTKSFMPHNAASQPTRAAPQLCNGNRFSVLDVPEPEVFPECEEEAPESPEAQLQLPPEPCPHRPKWEKRVGRKLVIRSLKQG